MPTNTPRLQIPVPGPGDPFKPVSVDLPAMAARIDAIAAREPGAVYAASPVLDVGQLFQLRAGRTLVPTDFTTLLGLSAPLGLWNLASVNDDSGNVRNLTNKGSVPFGIGINGAASSAAVFAGATSQALFLADVGGADPFRVKTGTFAAWQRTSKRSTDQVILSKYRAAAGNQGWVLEVDGTSNAAAFFASLDGSTATQIVGVSDVADDRWHHLAVTYDGMILSLYVDGALETVVSLPGLLFGTAAPLNIGGFGADGATAASSPHYGRIDTTYVTGDVLSADQIRLLYAARIAHSYAVTPTRAHMLVTRRRRGAALVVGDFPSAPARLHNFTAGALSEASGGAALTPNPGAGAITSVPGADGVVGGAQAFSGAHTGLSSTDAGLPAGTTARSYGAWFRGTSTATMGIMGWGTVGTTAYDLLWLASGVVRTRSGADDFGGALVNDGQWHHLVVVEDNAAADGLKRKLYVDGRVSNTSLVIGSITLAGADKFRVGALPDGTSPLVGQVDGAFVSAVALTSDQVRALYQKSALTLPASPKNEGDHVEGMDSGNLYMICDTLEPQHVVDLKVAG